MSDHPEESSDEIVSKSQLKREMSALQKIGTELVAMNPDQLKKLPLPDLLRRAVSEAQRIHSHGGLRRQMQYIGRLMRELDTEPLQEALAERKLQQQCQNARFHDLERWRDRLIDEGDELLGELIAEFAHADRQHLRQLIRAARKEQAQSKPPKSSRVLFRYLRELDQAETD